MLELVPNNTRVGGVGRTNNYEAVHDDAVIAPAHVFGTEAARRELLHFYHTTHSRDDGAPQREMLKELLADR